MALSERDFFGVDFFGESFDGHVRLFHRVVISIGCGFTNDITQIEIDSGGRWARCLVFVGTEQDLILRQRVVQLVEQRCSGRD